jgi:flavorubredoxin
MYVGPGCADYLQPMADNDRVLLAYGSKYGATAEIAEAIGKTLSAAGLEVGSFS